MQVLPEAGPSSDVPEVEEDELLVALLRPWSVEPREKVSVQRHLAPLVVDPPRQVAVVPGRQLELVWQRQSLVKLEREGPEPRHL